MDEEARYLSIDPGESDHNGYALFDETGFCIEYDQITREGLMDLLDEYRPQLKTVVLEDYRLFKNKALQQSGSKLETVRIIGAVEDFCRRHSIHLHLQRPDVLAIAQLWSGKKMPKNHAKSHWVSAYNHGYYYLVKQGIIKLKVRPEND